MTNPITASRERIAKEFDQLYLAEFRWVKERMHQPSASDWLSQTLLQHEATVKEEMARVVDSYKPKLQDKMLVDRDMFPKLVLLDKLNTIAQAIRTTKPNI